MKKGKKFLALLLSMLTLVLVGCSSLGEDFDEDDPDSTVSAVLDGTKVLSKPSDYDLEEAMDGYSTNFFNLFSKEVLELLYDVFEDPSLLTSEQRSALFAENFTLLDGTQSTLNTTDVITWSDFLDVQNFVDYGITNEATYLYDSIRQTVSKVSTDADSITTVTFSTSNAWNWTVGSGSTYGDSIFASLSSLAVEISGNNATIQSSSYDYETLIMYVQGNLDLGFSEIYFFPASAETSNGSVDYYYSPTYTSSLVSSVNYYQDVIEYVAYLTVLGYNPTDNAEYFDFTYQTSSGVVSGVTVGGWGSSKISLSGAGGALAQIKEVYEKIGQYVGLTDSDRQQIVDFILENVIGSSSDDEFTVTISKDGEADTTKTFSRNYEAMVERIVDMACIYVQTGTTSTLNDTFLIAEITDYSGDYFFSNEDSSGEGTFDYITAQEFQSLVIFPKSSDIEAEETFLGMILLFEYGGDDGENYASSITVNVGARYYNHSTKEVTDFGTGQIVLQAGAVSDLSVDDYAYLISSDDPDTISTLVQIEDIVFNSTQLADGRVEGCFNNSIGDNAINASEYGTEKVTSNGKIKSLTITGSSESRDYYKTNTSSGYGTYSTLNEEAFSGDDGCDFFELYFDVVKTGDSLSEIASTNYNFKVAFWSVLFY